MKRYFVILFLFSFILQACGLPFGPSGSDGVTSSEASVTGTEAPTNAGTPVIQHVMRPGTATERRALGHDNDETKSFEERSVNTGDEFRYDRFERPFTAESMDYLPYIDIKDFSISSDENWYYVQIQLAGLDLNNAAQGTYGAEFDLDSDGRAEILLVADQLGKDWTTDRVHVYVDQNADVGGFVSSPDDVYTGDGFETQLFESGKGQDADLAWARLINGSSLIAELAIKIPFLNGTDKFMWSVLASGTPVDPTKFYYNDTFTEISAGSPLKGSPNYPIKQIAAYDNTCRIPFGFNATGNEPLGCNTSKPHDTEFAPGKGYPSFCDGPCSPIPLNLP